MQHNKQSCEEWIRNYITFYRHVLLLQMMDEILEQVIQMICFIMIN